MKAMNDERGVAPIEFALAVGFLLIPMAVLVMSIAPWVERQSMARVAAGEAARVLVLSPGALPDEGAAASVVERIAMNHGLGVEDVEVFFCAGGDDVDIAVKRLSHCASLERGETFSVEVRVRVPVATLLGLGTFGEGTVSSTVSEKVELFRSFGP